MWHCQSWCLENKENIVQHLTPSWICDFWSLYYLICKCFPEFGMINKNAISVQLLLDWTVDRRMSHNVWMLKSEKA